MRSDAPAPAPAPLTTVQTAIVHSDRALAVHVVDDHQLCGLLHAGLFAAGALLALSGAELRLACALYHLVRPCDMSEAGQPFVCESQSGLRAITGLGRAAIQRGLKRLARRGVISIHERGNGKESAIYFLHVRARPSRSDIGESRLARLRGIPDLAIVHAADATLWDGRGIPSDAPGARATMPGGIPSDAPGARATMPLPKNSLENAQIPNLAGPRAREDIAAAAVLDLDLKNSSSSNAPAPDILAALLAAGFDAGASAHLAALPRCTLGQISVGIAAADRTEARWRQRGADPGFAPNRLGMIRRAIEQGWGPAAPLRVRQKTEDGRRKTEDGERQARFAERLARREIEVRETARRVALQRGLARFSDSDLRARAMDRIDELEAAGEGGRNLAGLLRRGIDRGHLRTSVVWAAEWEKLLEEREKTEDGRPKSEAL